MERALYLFIVSRAHSGSTILDILLGGSERIAGCGEIITGLQQRHSGYLCTCGATVADCPFWQAVRAATITADGAMVALDWEDFAEESIAQAHKLRIPATWWAATTPGRTPPRLAKLADATRRLAQAIRATSGKPVVLDSSKLPSRALFLMKFLPESRLIHLVRDPRSVLASHWWRFPIKDTWLAKRWLYRGPLMPLAFVEAGLFWLLGNLLFELIARIDPARAVRVRYEDLRDQPAVELRRIGTAFGLPVEDVIARLERGESLPVGHMAGGNSVRLMSGVRFDRGWEKKREPLPLALEWLTVLLCWPMMLRYGYSLRRPSYTPPVGPVSTASGSVEARSGR
jgi:hypothetical protein